MKTTRFFLALIFSITIISAQGQRVDQNWKNAISTAVESFKSCDQSADNSLSLCTTLIGESIKKVYMIDDFYSKTDGRYMTGNEIITNIGTNSKWKLLGYAYEQQALTLAQEYANAGKAALAVYENEEKIGNVSIILPGELIKSGSWGFDVPNSAAFIIEDPAKSYFDKGLSYAFSRSIIRKVMIYGRSY